jgi:cytochrome c oxidase subunit 2
MYKKIIIWVVAIGIIILVTAIIVNKNKKNYTPQNVINNTQTIHQSVFDDKTAVKEFSMTSFVDMTGGTPKPQYSLKEISVNKGDNVRIKVTVTSGMHNFNIDEYNIHVDTELNKEAVIEFVADKTGEFTYYCSRPGHRQNGHWGTLKVL